MHQHSSKPKQFDVAIIGGGPAGASVATFLAQKRWRVTLIEKVQHPRFHIGESLLPQNLPIIERLGLSHEISEIGVLKPGVEFVSPQHEKRKSYFFRDALFPSPTYSFHVQRAEFDEILFRHAIKAGVTVRENSLVTETERTAAGWNLSLRESGEADEVSAKYLIDASGRDGFMARKHGLRTRDRKHNSAALFTHYKNVSPDAWETAGNIAIYWFEHGWIWMIPLPDGITSIGAVCMPDYLNTRVGGLEEFFEDTLRLCPKALAVMKDATRVSGVTGAGNYAYKAKQAFGDGYLLIGDSYAFLDPVFSTGVLLAMSSAERAALVVDAILGNSAKAAGLKRTYQRDLNRAIRRITWFVVRFNTPVLKYLFMGSRDVLGVTKSVISILSGDVYRRGTLGWRLGIFKIMFAVSHIKIRKLNKAASKRLRQLPAISMPENESS
ncbi:MAG: FAD-dependent oxidoreductase [Rhodospirillales bacterium]|nr:FAD-dependent oxidoreductase [Rhodospirillales bacterium]MBT6218502.1 FAD-dependent oxidoreductase [Rhodospirillaceae bacterium]MBT7485813.1 FAD-dependent oxidoreductase [Rhodospirillales bacterium]MBT8002104.1 FAD-dependent oxidoreductase [Rhodospirillales bacterium]